MSETHNDSVHSEEEITKRNKRIYIRVTDEEKAHINSNAGNQPASTYLRNLGLRNKVRKHYIELSPVQTECDRNFRGVGNNLNQLVTHVHSANKRGDVDATLYIQLLTELQRLSDSTEAIENELASYRKANVYQNP